jgi:hypothetical protein
MAVNPKRAEARHSASFAGGLARPETIHSMMASCFPQLRRCSVGSSSQPSNDPAGLLCALPGVVGKCFEVIVLPVSVYRSFAGARHLVVQLENRHRGQLSLQRGNNKSQDPLCRQLLTKLRKDMAPVYFYQIEQ